MAHWSVFLAFSLSVSPAFGQLPPSIPLSPSDQPLFQAEIARLEALRNSAPDQAAVMYQIARTWAYAKQWPETIEWLGKVVALRAGLDPSRDSIFAELRGTREFEAIDAAVRDATPPVSHSRAAFTIPEGDLVPENLASDPRGKQFYFGSMRKGKVLRCTARGNCTPFTNGLGVVLGLKIRGDGLWLLSNADKESALIHFDLASAREIRRYTVAGTGHTFNDLVFAPAGDVYLTDTRAGAIWHLPKDAGELTKLPGQFTGANGIAVSPEGDRLFVSTFPDGISMVDLKTGIIEPIKRPDGLCLATIDGLYFYHGTLIAIQNGFMTPRVIRFTLSRDRRAIERFQVLERRNPLFDGVTTGVIAGVEFFYMANIQDEKSDGFRPLAILKLRL